MPRPALSADRLEPRELPAAAFATLPLLPAGDPAVADTARAIVAAGAARGRTADAFMKVGDSNSDPGFGAGYLFPLGNPANDAAASSLLAAHPELRDTLAAYRTPAGGTGTNSFARVSTVAVAGARTAGVLDGVAAEADATDAAVALVMIGTNDVVAGTPLAAYKAELEDLVRRLAAAGVVPVLGTIPDDAAFGGTFAALVPAYNQVVADVADEFHAPLMNTWRALAGLPDHGLDPAGLHLSASPTAGGAGPADLLYGQNARALLALQVLDWFRTAVTAPAPAAEPPRPWTPLAAGETVVAVGRGAGQPPLVSVLDAAGTEVDRFTAFDPAFTGGVRVATADVTGDGIPDVVVGAGDGGGPAVRVFSGADGTVAASFFAFEPAARGGVNVAAADLDGDGAAEVVVGAGDGGGPAVAVYRGRTFTEAARYFAYEPAFRGGVEVAAGAVAGVGPAVVTGAGAGGGPVVKVFRPGDDTPVVSYFAYEETVRTGVAVAVADLGGGGAVATVPAAGVPHVSVVDVATNTVRASFYAPETGGYGVRLGTLHAAAGDTLLIATGPGSTPQVEAVNGADVVPFGLGDSTRAYGVYVG